MRSTAWRKLVRRHLLPALPQFRLAGSILVHRDVDWILHGIVPDTSAFGRGTIRLAALHVPLYVPFPGMIGAFGEDLKHPRTGHQWWDVDLEDEVGLASLVLESLQQQGLAFLARLSTPADLAKYSERRYRGTDNPPNLEIEAYSWLLEGEVSRFALLLKRFESAVAAMDSPQSWDLALLDRVQIVRYAADAGSDAVRQVLGRWRDDSVRQHKLEKLTAPYASDHW